MPTFQNGSRIWIRDCDTGKALTEYGEQVEYDPALRMHTHTVYVSARGVKSIKVWFNAVKSDIGCWLVDVHFGVKCDGTCWCLTRLHRGVNDCLRGLPKYPPLPLQCFADESYRLEEEEHDELDDLGPGVTEQLHKAYVEITLGDGEGPEPADVPTAQRRTQYRAKFLWRPESFLVSKGIMPRPPTPPPAPSPAPVAGTEPITGSKADAATANADAGANRDPNGNSSASASTVGANTGGGSSAKASASIETSTTSKSNPNKRKHSEGAAPEASAAADGVESAEQRRKRLRAALIALREEMGDDEFASTLNEGAGGQSSSSALKSEDVVKEEPQVDNTAQGAAPKSENRPRKQLAFVDLSGDPQ